jgi:REP element-mobilizing transposase RayT
VAFIAGRRRLKSSKIPNTHVFYHNYGLNRIIGTAFAVDKQSFKSDGKSVKMGSDNYIQGRQTCYFITLNTVDWVDVFIRPVYKQVIVHTLNHFIDNKGLTVYGWCLMTNHLHLLAQARDGYAMNEIEKELKTFTATKILEALDTEPEARKDWMLKRFENFGNILGLMKKFHVWQNSGMPVIVDLRKTDALIEHFFFIHENPVRDRFVDTAADYPYSSARDYAGMPGPVKITKLTTVEQLLAASESFNSNFFVKYIRN